MNALKQAAQFQLPDISEALVALKDKSINIDERWNAYSAMVNNGVLNNEQSWGDGFLDVLKRTDGRELTMYDDFYVERHQTMSFVDMYDAIMEYSIMHDAELTSESIENWRETVLASGLASFVHDW